MSKQKNVTVILLFDQPVLGHDYRLENLETLITYFEQKLSLPQIILVTGYSDKYLLGSKYTKKVIKIKNERWQETRSVKALSLGLYASTNDRIIVVDNIERANIGQLEEFCINAKSSVITKLTLADDSVVGCSIANEALTLLWYGLPYEYTNMFYITKPELTIIKPVVDDPNNERKFMFEVLNQAVEAGGVFEVL